MSATRMEFIDRQHVKCDGCGAAGHIDNAKSRRWRWWPYRGTVRHYCAACVKSGTWDKFVRRAKKAAEVCRGQGVWRECRKAPAAAEGTAADERSVAG